LLGSLWFRRGERTPEKRQERGPRGETEKKDKRGYTKTQIYSRKEKSSERTGYGEARKIRDIGTKSLPGYAVDPAKKKKCASNRIKKKRTKGIQI